jgi:hypothetical protein
MFRSKLQPPSSGSTLHKEAASPFKTILQLQENMIPETIRTFYELSPLSEIQMSYNEYRHISGDLTNSVALVRERNIPRDRRLSAKLMPTFADRGVSHGQCGGSPTAVILVF